VSRVNVSAFHAEMIFFPENITTIIDCRVSEHEFVGFSLHTRHASGFSTPQRLSKARRSTSIYARARRCGLEIESLSELPMVSGPRHLVDSLDRSSAAAPALVACRGGGARGAALWACDMTTPHSRMQCSMWSNSHDAHLEEPYSRLRRVCKLF
jgi:hypothetical protein